MARGLGAAPPGRPATDAVRPTRVRDRGLLPDAARPVRGRWAGSTCASGCTPRSPTCAGACSPTGGGWRWSSRPWCTTWAAPARTGIESAHRRALRPRGRAVRGQARRAAGPGQPAAGPAGGVGAPGGAAGRSGPTARPPLSPDPRRPASWPPSPTRVPDHNPLGGSARRRCARRRGVGRGDLVVCSLEAWDEVWRRNQFFVRELLALDPGAPGAVRRAALRPGARTPAPVGPDAPAGAAAPARGSPQSCASSPSSCGRGGPARWPTARCGARFVGPPNASGSPIPPCGSTTRPTPGWPPRRAGRRSTTSPTTGPARVTARGPRPGWPTGNAGCSPSASGWSCARRGWPPAAAELRPDLTLIPNGVDVEHLQRPRPRPPDLPAGPTAVYVGTLAHRPTRPRPHRRPGRGPTRPVDRPGRTRRPRSDRSGPTGARPNVQLLGARPYDQVPGYLQHASVVIVPHVVSAFTESLDPIKAYECLAVGRPTVATAVAGFRGLPEPDPAWSIGRRSCPRCSTCSTHDRRRRSRPGAPPIVDRAGPMLRPGAAPGPGRSTEWGGDRRRSRRPSTASCTSVRPEQILGGLVRGWRAGTPVVIDARRRVAERR